MLVSLNGFFNVLDGQIEANGGFFHFDTSKNGLPNGMYHGAIQIDKNYNAYAIALTESDLGEGAYEHLKTLVTITVTGNCAKVAERTAKSGSDYLFAMVVAFGDKKDDETVSAQFFSAIVNQEKPFKGNVISITGNFFVEQLQPSEKPRNEFQTFGLGMSKGRAQLAGWANGEPSMAANKKVAFTPTVVKVVKTTAEKKTENVKETEVEIVKDEASTAF